MNMVSVFVLAVLFLFPESKVIAANYTAQPEKKTSSVSIKRPEAEKTISRPGNLTASEGFKDYSVRRFQETNTRIDKNEVYDAQLKKEISDLRQALAELKAKAAEIDKKLEEQDKKKEEDSQKTQ